MRPSTPATTATLAVVPEEQSAGKRRVGGPIDVLDAQGFDHPGGQYLALVHVREGASTVVDADGRVVEEYDSARDATMQVGVLWAGDGWFVDGVAVDIQGSS